MKPLVINKKDKIKGLYTYCKQCKRLIESRQCVNTGKRLSTCKTPEKHIFKAIVTIPNTDGKKKKTKEFNTRNLNEAIRLKLEFQEELERLEYQSVEVLATIEEQVKPTLLIECMTLFIGYLNNEGVQIHKQKKRTKKHIDDVERIFSYFCLSLKESRIDHTIFRMDQMSDTVVGMFHSYLLTVKDFENKTYNKYIAQMRQFIDWLINDKNYGLTNPFTGVQRRQETIDKTIVTKKEFNALLSVLSRENGIKVFPSGEQKNMYRDWVKEAFIIALETGLRREEFMTLQFSDVIEDETGNPIFIRVENFKVNRILGIEEEGGKQRKVIPVTQDFQTILIELEYEQNRNTDSFLIGKNSTASRSTMIDFVSKSFSHFWKQLELSKTAQLKSLRKTYLTALVNHFGDKAPIISNHSGLAVLKKHYVNDEEMMNKVDGFSVF